MSKINATKVILISGGSRGLGKAFVESLLAQGHRIYTFSRNETPFISTAAKAYPNQLFWESIDGTDFDSVDDFVRRLFEREGCLDILLNNAGRAAEGVLTLMKTQDISSVLALNLEGTIRLARISAKYMLQAGEGVIINISSIIGIRGYSGSIRL